MAFPQMGAPQAQIQGQLPLAKPTAMAGGVAGPPQPGQVAPGAIPGHAGGIQGALGGMTGGPSATMPGSLPLASHPLPSMPGQLGGGIPGAPSPAPVPGGIPGQLGGGIAGAPSPQPSPWMPSHMGPAGPQAPGAIPTIPGRFGPQPPAQGVAGFARRILGRR